MIDGTELSLKLKWYYVYIYERQIFIDTDDQLIYVIDINADDVIDINMNDVIDINTDCLIGFLSVGVSDTVRV